uniref:VP5.1 n=1 Tax=Lychas mucronatus TaxID=172552 RepID=A0A0U1SJ92_LYCMC|nr:VP5.1 [Lychas mucronatus]
MNSFKLFFALLLLFTVYNMAVGQRRGFCGPNEEIKPCGPCDGTCRNPNPICTQDCRPPACGCVRGTVRGPSGLCIPLRFCFR